MNTQALEDVQLAAAHYASVLANRVEDAGEAACRLSETLELWDADLKAAHPAAYHLLCASLEDNDDLDQSARWVWEALAFLG